MVVRKSSFPIPYPASPPPPPPPPEPSTQPSHLQVDSADIPPVPTTKQRSNASHNFEEMGNPWQDAESPRPDQSGARPVPDVLKPGLTPPLPPSGSSLQHVPDVLRPGWSGEATPRSSLDSSRSPEREWWDDDVADDEAPPAGHDASHQLSQELHVVDDTPSGPAVQGSSAVRRKPVPASPNAAVPPQQPPEQSSEFASNNPFRRPSDTYLPPDPEPAAPSKVKTNAREDHPHPLRSSPSTDQLGMLSLSHPTTEKEAMPPLPTEKETIPLPPSTAPPQPPPLPQQAPPPIPQLQEPLVPSQTGSSQDANPWSLEKIPAPSPSSFAPAKQHDTFSTDDLLDRGHHEGSLSLGDELKALPNNATAPKPFLGSDISLLEDDDPPGPAKPPRPTRQESDDMYSPPPGPPPSHQRAPLKPPRPAVVTSEADLAKLQEQRNETYQIKHFNWYDLRTSRMRRSSMLTQNENGPCPLLALVNALILGATEDMQAALDDALRLREQVTLGLIIETLMDELLSRASMVQDLQLPDVDELNRFLMRLRSGMNANPRFVPAAQPAPNLMDADTPTTPTAPPLPPGPGTFEHTQDIKLYGSFRVKLVHGWLPEPHDQASKAFARSAQTYEDAQAIQFGEEELEYKLSSSGLTQPEQHVWEDITSIKHFFQTYPTQLTQYGLSIVQQTLEPGEFAILFRNDHFSTIYKHPRDQRLYTLITDAGYADRDEIIWESLVDINGSRSEFFSGDFNSVSNDLSHTVSHSQSDAANPQGQRPGSSQYPHQPDRLDTNDSFHTAPALTPQEAQEQADMDFALALQMQEEEEQAQRRARAQQSQSQSQQTGRTNRRDSGIRPSPPTRRQNQNPSSIPIPLRSNPGGEVRPIIPPRNQNSNRNQGVNRPTDATQTDAPPAYEEAARQSAYIPPVGSPLHPSSSTDLPQQLQGRASTSTSSVHASGQMGGNQRSGQHARRTSAYGDNNDGRHGSSPDYSAGVYGPTYAYMTPTSAEGRRRPGEGRDRDCIVM